MKGKAWSYKYTGIILISLFLPLLGFAKEQIFCYFTPPNDWQCADPTKLSPHVQVGFFGKSEGIFHPSLNLAIEEIENTTLKEYLGAVKQIHESDHNTTWRDLGKFQTKAGTAELTEITTKNNWGEIKMLQLILIAHHKAYIITGAMLKDEFHTFRKDMIKAFRSLTLTSDLINDIPHPEKKKIIQDTYQKIYALQEDNTNAATLGIRKHTFDDFQKLILNESQEMGLHWQILLLKEAFQQLNLLPPKNG